MTARPSVVIRVAEALEEAQRSVKRAEPCVLVIFGAGGDLTRRKLMPAIYHLRRDGLLHDGFAIVGVAREEMADDSFRAAMREAVATFGETAAMDDATWSAFARRMWYVCGDLGDDATYKRVADKLAAIERDGPLPAGRLFYLAIPPGVYAEVINHVSASGIGPRTHDPKARPWIRTIIEKPFGNSADSAQKLNRIVRRSLAEHQVYRIDHYLGKETVQNLLVFRFANSIFEPVWNRQHIDHVQITAAETVGVGTRAGYYERAGVVRDMFQNHLLQLLTLTAMEPPVTFSADAVRDEKVKVLHAVRPIPPEGIHEFAVRGQYGAGTIGGEAVPGYREEPKVAPDSDTPTFAAVRLMVDNWRWQGVPFYLRSGKRLARRATEIAIQFRKPPHLMFPLPPGKSIESNLLAIRVQPEEGIALRFEVKVPGVDIRMASVDMDFRYAEAFGGEEHEAYETLLLDCMLGDATLFTRSDEVEAAWGIVDPVIGAWAGKPAEHFPNYAAGSWGPAIADEFLARCGAVWRKL